MQSRYAKPYRSFYLLAAGQPAQSVTAFTFFLSSLNLLLALKSDHAGFLLVLDDHRNVSNLHSIPILISL